MPKKARDPESREKQMLGLVALWVIPGAIVPSESAHSLISQTLGAVDTLSNATGVSQKQPLQVHVLAYQRPDSLVRLLDSLRSAEYLGDTVDLHIHIDGANENTNKEKANEVHEIAERARVGWAHGASTISAAPHHLGLRDMWLNAWTPKSDDEHAIILEDDLELSRQWYHWLKPALKMYQGKGSNLAGVSLQRLAWAPSGKPLDRLPGHAPILSSTVSTWAFSPDASHWLKFQRYVRERSASAGTVSLFSSMNSGYSLQAGWDQKDPELAKDLWSPAFAAYCRSQGLVTLYPSLQPDYHALAVHWRTKGTHYKSVRESAFSKGSSFTKQSLKLTEKADFMLAHEWMPGMGALPPFKDLSRVPHNGFVHKGFEHGKIAMIAADATQDAMEAYKKLEEEAAAAAEAAEGASGDSELFTVDAWEWDEDRARQVLTPDAGQCAILAATIVNLFLLAFAAIAKAAGWMTAKKEEDEAKKTDVAVAGSTFITTTEEAKQLAFSSMLKICVPCAELSFWLIYVTMAEWVFPSRARAHSPGDFWELMVLLAFVSILWQRPVKPAKGAASVLSRDISNEWRGWMQVAFLMYHYCHMQEVYPFIRLLVTAYVWQTGYGNGIYFSLKKEFTGERCFQMLWRLNFIVFLLVLATRTPWIAYYVCALHTVHFLLIFGSMALACMVFYRKYNVEWWPITALVGLTVFSVIMWDIPNVWEYTVGPIFSFTLGSDFDRELHFRTFLDHYSSCFGLFAAIMVPYFEKWANKSPMVCYATLGSIAAVLAGLWFVVYANRRDDDIAYDNVHPYISCQMLWGYVLVRGCTKKMRETVSVPLVFIGIHSLEFYLLQFHLFLSQEAQAILMIVPNKRLNIALCIPIYALCAYRLFYLTNVIKDLFFALKNVYRVTIMVMLCFGAAIAGVTAAGDLPTWAMWPCGLALMACAPLIGFLFSLKVPKEERPSPKAASMMPLLIAALLVPTQLTAGAVLQPLVKAGKEFNANAGVPWEPPPDWDQSVIDGTCVVTTLPASWTPYQNFAEACPAAGNAALDGWRSAAKRQMEVHLPGETNQTVEDAKAVVLDAIASMADGNKTTVTTDDPVVMFFGDSTVRFQFKFFAELLSSEVTELTDFSLTAMAPNTTGGDRPAPPDPTQCFVWHAHGNIGDQKVTAIYVGSGILVPVQHAPMILAQLDQAPYNLDVTSRARMIVVGSSALHHLHLHPTKEWEEDEKESWLTLESRVQQGFGGLLTKFPKAKLMYFTIHSMCDELLLEAGWPEEAANYNLGNFSCVGDRCGEASFNRQGALNWYRREMNVLRNFAPNGHISEATRFGVIDAFKITDGQCWATADGRHFNPLVPQFGMKAFTHFNL